ncbi:MAG: AAA family ATPase [Myxococcota bacterium]
MEHLQHFGLTQDPFSNESDLRLYFESPSHRDAQRRVERGLRQHKGLTLLTGEGGMGKTLLARRILDGLEEEVFEATLLVMLPGAADAMGIFQRFARQLGAEEPARDRAGVLGQIYEQLAIVREDGRHAVLIVDDAQVMSPQVFAELGGLLSLEYEDRRLMSMLLVGSPELDRQIQNDASLLPRVDIRVRIRPLDMPAAAAYLKHRLQVAHARPDLIPPATLDVLYKLGRGRPRLLNTLADNALFEAYLAGRSAMEPADVERAAADLGIGFGTVGEAGGAGPDDRSAGVGRASAAAMLAASAPRSPSPFGDIPIETGPELELTEALGGEEWSSALIEDLDAPAAGNGLQESRRAAPSLEQEMARFAAPRPPAQAPMDGGAPELEGLFVELIEE